MKCIAVTQTAISELGKPINGRNVLAIVSETAAGPRRKRRMIDSEIITIGNMAAYPEAVAEACEAFEPSVVTRSLIAIAQTTASYLTAGTRDRGARVLVEGDDELKAARLHLVDAVRTCLAHGLALLGCQAPDTM